MGIGLRPFYAAYDLLRYAAPLNTRQAMPQWLRRWLLPIMVMCLVIFAN